MNGFLLQNLLAVAAWMINRKRTTSVQLQKILDERQNTVFQVRIRKGWGGHFIIKDGAIHFSRKIHSEPDFEQIWNNEWAAVKVMTSKDETDFLRAFEDGKYTLSGDFSLAIWFNEVMKITQN